jgi:hypothetical protein
MVNKNFNQIQKQIKYEKKSAFLLIFIIFLFIVIMATIYSFKSFNIFYIAFFILISPFIMQLFNKKLSIQFVLYFTVFMTLFAVFYLLSVPVLFFILNLLWKLKSVLLLTPVYFLLITENRAVFNRLYMNILNKIKTTYRKLASELIEICVEIFKQAMNLLTNYFLLHIFISFVIYIYHRIFGISNVFGLSITLIKNYITIILAVVAMLHITTLSLYYINNQYKFKLVIIIIFLIVLLKIFIRGLPV